MKELIMKTTICGAALLLSLTMASCEVYESPEINQGLNEENNTSLYTDAYDPISNVGQYYMPEMKVKPKKYWNCVEVVTAVSYTHLDVYKRQVFIYILLHSTHNGVLSASLNEVFWPDKPDDKVKNLKGVTINQIRKNLAELDGVEPVSYTHLTKKNTAIPIIMTPSMP